MESLEIKFTRTNTVYDNRRPYTVYELEVHTKLSHSWVLFKRYSSFHALHQQLLKDLQFYPETYAGVKLPVLPPKRLTRLLASEFVEKRKAELREYMTAVLKIRQLKNSSIMIAFLEIPESFRPMFTQNAFDTESDSDEALHAQSNSLTKPDRYPQSQEDTRISTLLKTLNSPSHLLRNKVAALRDFESYFFQQRPRLKPASIALLLGGGRAFDVGLIQSCGDFNYSHISSSAALHLLCRLLDIEKNKEAELFLSQVVKVDPSELRKMQLRYHIIEEKGNRLNAYRLIDMLTGYDREDATLTVDNIVTDPYAREDYNKWLARTSTDVIAMGGVMNTTPDIKESLSLQDGNATTSISAGLFQSLLAASNDTVGWRDVPFTGEEGDHEGDTKFMETVIVEYKPTVLKPHTSSKWSVIRNAYNISKEMNTQSSVAIFGTMRAHCTFPFSPSVTRKYLVNLRLMAQWDHKFEQGAVIETLGNGSADVVHFAYNSFSSPHKYRDMCLIRVEEPYMKGGFLLAAKSVVHEGAKEKEGSTRCSVAASGYVLRPSVTVPGGTDLTLVLQGDKEAMLIVSQDILGDTNDTRQALANIHRLETEG